MDQMDQKILGEDNSDSLPKTDMDTNTSTYLDSESNLSSKKRGPLGQMWMATLNNWTEEEYSQMDHILDKSGWPAGMGKEVGKSGTPHLQIWVNFGQRVRPTEMKVFSKLRRIHWGDEWGKPQKCNKDHISGPTYCAKEGNARMYNGARPKREVKFPEFNKWWQIEICNLIDTEPDDRTIHWFWSSQKGVGKTTFAKYLVMKKGACILDGKKNDIKNAVLTWLTDKKEYPPLCIWNIPASLDADYISYTALEQVKDALFYSGKYEGGPVTGACPHVIVFSNVYPNGGDMDPKRFVIHNVNEPEPLAFEVKPAWAF